MPHFTRLVLLACAASLAACQCFVPVGEYDGGGRGGGTGGSGGGTGGGSAGGAGGGGATSDAGRCRVASDCRGDAGTGFWWCSNDPVGWTCAFGDCVAECPGGRTCGWDAGSCTTCDGMTDCPTTAVCPMMTQLYIELAGPACAQWQGVSLKAFSLSSRVCTYGLQLPDGGSAGFVTWYGYSTLSADLPFLGGGCVGEQAPTGAIRFSTSCPTCMVSLRPEP